MMRAICAAAMIVALTAPAFASPPAVAPAPMLRGSYEEAMVCYQYFQIAQELARKLEKVEPDADKAAGFQLKAIAARTYQARWSGRVDDLKGARAQKQLDADLKRLGAPVVADANATLAGDKDASVRVQARAALCGDGGGPKAAAKPVK